MVPSNYLDVDGARQMIAERFSRLGISGAVNASRLVQNSIKPNLLYDEALTQSALNDELSKISYTRGEVAQGKLIIAKGEIVEAEDFKVLN